MYNICFAEKTANKSNAFLNAEGYLDVHRLPPFLGKLNIWLFVFVGGKTLTIFLRCSGGFFSGLSLKRVDFLELTPFWVVGEDTVEDPGVFFAPGFLAVEYSAAS